MGKAMDENDTQPLIDDQSPNKKNICSHGWTFPVEPTVFLNALALSPMSLVSEQFIYAKIGEEMGYDVKNMTTGSNSSCDTNFSDPTTVAREAIQAKTVYFSLYLTLVETLPVLFSIMYFGLYADRHGRKRLLLLSPIGNLCQAIVYLIASYLNISKYWLLPAKIVYGAFGASKFSFMAGRLVLADSVPSQNLPFRLVLLSVCYYVGESISDLGLNLLLKQTNFVYTYICILSLNILCILYVSLFITESFPENLRKKHTININNISTIYCKDNGKNRLWKTYVLFLAEFVIHIVSFSTTYLLMNAPFCWDSDLLGYYNAAEVVGRFET